MVSLDVLLSIHTSDDFSDWFPAVSRCRMSLGNPADSEGWEEINGVLRTVFTRNPSACQKAVWNLSLANAKITNVAQGLANAFGLVRFVCQHVDVQRWVA